MKILETAALTDEVYFAFIDLAAKYSDRFSFEMNEPISEKAVQTKRNIIMETIADGSVGMEMKERIVAQQLDALVCAPVETLQYYTCCIPYMRLMERHELKGAEPAAGRRFYDVNRHTVALLKVPLSLRAWSGTAYPMNLSFFTERNAWLYYISHEDMLVYDEQWLRSPALLPIRRALRQLGLLRKAEKQTQETRGLTGRAFPALFRAEAQSGFFAKSSRWVSRNTMRFPASSTAFRSPSKKRLLYGSGKTI